MRTHEEEGELDCREALHRIYHFLDGEMTSDRRKTIEAHLDGCSPCLQMFGFEAELRRVVQMKCQETAPPGLRERIAAAISHEHEHDAEVSASTKEPHPERAAASD
jgi:mycothiol system anti-sigma-R factor